MNGQNTNCVKSRNLMFAKYIKLTYSSAEQSTYWHLATVPKFLMIFINISSTEKKNRFAEYSKSIKSKGIITIMPHWATSALIEWVSAYANLLITTVHSENSTVTFIIAFVASHKIKYFILNVFLRCLHLSVSVIGRWCAITLIKLNYNSVINGKECVEMCVLCKLKETKMFPMLWKSDK